MISSERSSPIRIGRFERRVVAAIATVAVMPLIAALVLGYGVVGDAYRVGVNERIREELDEAMRAQQRYLEARHLLAVRTLEAISSDHGLVESLARGDAGAASTRIHAVLAERAPEIAELSITRAEGTVARATAENAEPRADDLELERAIEGAPGAIVRARFRAPTEGRPHEALGRGATREVYRYLDRAGDALIYAFLLVYFALLLAVAVVALAVGLVLSRRVTRRVVVLAEATARVGRGDLTVEVPTDEADEVGELTRAFNAMVRDIRDSRDRIEYLQRVGAWQEMARRLAHEIKNPLTPIQLAVQELHRSYHGDHPRFRRTLDEVRDIVEEEVTTLRRLVKEFGEFARLPEPALEPADLGAFVRDAMRGVEPAALASEGSAPPPGLALPEIAIELDRRPLPVKIDGQMLRRCLDNLVRNAVQAIVGSRARSGPGARVIVAARRDRDHAILEVRDDGPGVPTESRERVFDPYFTTREQGTGLGLAIVKKVVLEHGGSISCGEASEGGAAFRIRLPLASGERRSRP